MTNLTNLTTMENPKITQLQLIRDQYCKGLTFVQGNRILQEATQSKIDQLTREIISLDLENETH